MSKPAVSSSGETRSMPTAFIIPKMMPIVTNAQMQIEAVPINWIMKLVEPLARCVLGRNPIAMQPQMPHKPWTGQAPTGSSIFNLSSITMPSTTRRPATAPTTTDQPFVKQSQQAVIPTKPPKAPLRLIVKSGLPNMTQLRIVAVTTPAAADKVVLTAINTVASMSPVPWKASWLPGLNPYQPTHKLNTPRAAKATL